MQSAGLLVLTTLQTVVGFELVKPSVVYVTPTGWCAEARLDRLVHTCTEAARGGAAMIQIRDHKADEEEIQAATRSVRRALEMAGCEACPVVVNGYLLDAAAAGASGVHLRESAVREKDMDLKFFVSRCRVVLEQTTGRPAIVGCSAHSVESVLLAAAAGVDYVQVGTMFPTATHPEKKIVEGPELVAAVLGAFAARNQPAPVLVGVGGIEDGNCAEVVKAGAHGVAVIRAIAASAAPADAVAKMRDTMAAALSSSSSSTLPLG
ncbi:hypothetical protein CTAYLR_010412 [Chrysophaeum taylorii]|uniref:Thiamine phosphate synthase/TenI domain-containing protein n=1 Tax=Chrysophaeum taylorii TaxID=2483200 RepID=A0AAD7UFN5_9STRA|nr:hypothetical protein CTAYLR_010412 [Chrysophaeum taylorii]